MRKTKEDAEITRNTLLDAALVVFSRQGYEITRLEDIAQEAKVTRGAIYHHFGGKVELYNALVAERFARANQVWSDALTQSGTPLEVIRRLIVRVLQYLEEDADYRAIQELVLFKTPITPELESSVEAKRAGTRALIDYLAKLIEQGIDTRLIRPGTNPRDAALAIIGLMNGVSTMWLLDQSLFSLCARAENIADTFLTGITT